MKSHLVNKIRPIFIVLYIYISLFSQPYIVEKDDKENRKLFTVDALRILYMLFYEQSHWWSIILSFGRFLPSKTSHHILHMKNISLSIFFLEQQTHIRRHKDLTSLFPLEITNLFPLEPQRSHPLVSINRTVKDFLKLCKFTCVK